MIAVTIVTNSYCLYGISNSSKTFQIELGLDGFLPFTPLETTFLYLLSLLLPIKSCLMKYQVFFFHIIILTAKNVEKTSILLHTE